MPIPGSRAFARLVLSSAPIVIVGLVGCAKPSATITGSALSIDFSDIKQVFFGGPYIVMTPSDNVTCETVVFVRQSYETGSPPTTTPIELLQFTFVGADVSTGPKSIALSDSEVTSIVLATDGTHFDFDRATAGSIQVDTLNSQKTASGSFSGVTFADGSVDGDFDAEWCTNLKDR